MSRLFYHTMQDNAGNLLFDVVGTFRLAGSGTLATIYGDEALTVILPNPMTNHPSFGSFKCFLGAGDYDFYLAKAGYTFETLTGVQGHGSMAQQDAGAVAITGGTAIVAQLGIGATYQPGHVLDTASGGLCQFNGPVGMGTIPVAGHGLDVGGILVVAGSTFLEATQVNGALNALAALHGGTTLQVDGTSQLTGHVGVGGASTTGVRQTLHYAKDTITGMQFLPYVSDTGGGRAMQFMNIAGGEVGYITTNATTTTYATTSDGRLKHDVRDLTGELALVQALRPVRFTWKVDGSEGRGFLAHEVAALVDGVITGEADALNDDGSIRPQGIDYSKLVPYLVGAVKTLAAQVERLTARLEACGG